MKGLLQARGESFRGGIAGVERFGRLAGGGDAGDLSLQQSGFDAGDAGGFAGAVDVWHRGLLLFIDFDEACGEAATK
jgi:hypothetical protein